MGGGVESPRGIVTYRVEEFPQGDENAGVTHEGDGVPGHKKQGREGTETPPPPKKPEPAAPPSSQRVTAAGRGREVSTYRHPYSANGARPEHGLLAPEEPAGDPDAAELQECREVHEATMGAGGPEVRETETGDRKGKCTLLACSHKKDGDEDRIPPERQRMINACDHKGGEGGGPLTQQRALTACRQGREGDTPTRPHAPPSRSQEMEEGRGPPTQQRALPTRSQGIEGYPPTRQRTPPLRSQWMEKVGGLPTQQSALPARGQGRKGTP